MMNYEIKTEIVIADGKLEFKCGEKEYGNLHLEYLIQFKTEGNQITKVYINQKEFDLEQKYDYMSQGNIHVIFYSEDCKWVSLNLDGHKGDMYVRGNSIINFLVLMLNEELRKSKEYNYEKNEEKVCSYLLDYEKYEHLI